MQSKNFIFVFLFWMVSSVSATWIWNPEIGWINSKYDPQGNAKSLYEEARKLMDAKRDSEAAVVFENLAKMYPNTPEAKNALYLGAQCRYNNKDYYASYLLYEEYISRYPNTDKMQEILEKEYEIGALMIRGQGEGSSFLGICLSACPEDGVEILEKLLQNSPYLSFADDARLTIANYYYKESEYKDAEEHYKKLIKEYPKSEWCSFAHYQLGACSLKQFNGLPYDGQPLRDAKQKFENYLKKYPNSEQAKNAEEKRQEVISLLGQKELEIAQYYIRHGYTISARIYLAHIMRKFEGTQIAEQAKLFASKLED